MKRKASEVFSEAARKEVHGEYRKGLDIMKDLESLRAEVEKHSATYHQPTCNSVCQQGLYLSDGAYELV